MEMQRRLTLGLCGLLAVTEVLACGSTDASHGLLIRPDHNSYRAGDPIGFILTNQSGRPVWYRCNRVEGLDPDSGWTASFGGTSCASREESAQLRRVGPGETLRLVTQTNRCAYSGRWRVVVFVRDSSGTKLRQSEHTSNEFHIVGGWSRDTSNVGAGLAWCRLNGGSRRPTQISALPRRGSGGPT